MGYFPFFVDLQGKAGLVVGAGAVARRKVEKLLPFGARLRVVAPEICPALRELPGVTLDQRLFRPEDLEGVDFAVAAAGQRPGGPTGGPTVPQDGNPRQHGGRRGGDLPLSGAHPKGDADGGGLHRGVSPERRPASGTGWRRRCRTGPRRSSCACMHTGACPRPAGAPPAAALAAALEACLERGRPLEPAEQERLLEEYRTGGERK